MKISQEEIDAAVKAYADKSFSGEPESPYVSMNRAIEAALRVRKERKKQKREKAGLFANLTPEQKEAALAYRGPETHGGPIPPKPLTFESGKSYRTRDGREVIITRVCRQTMIGFIGVSSFVWWSSGAYSSSKRPTDLDLIAPWED